VRAEGKLQETPGAGGGKYDSRKFKFVERVNYSELQDFVVYIEGKVTNAPAYKPRTLQVITQRDAVFRPHVLPVVAGTTVEWPNKDEIFHNVFSMSETKEFDLGLYRDPEVKKVTFDKKGRVDVFCSIHSKMNCVVLVLENPWFAAADKNGHFRIENVPAGTYRLKAWHERVPSQVQEIVVPEKGEVRADFVLGIKNLPKY
jgi:plastocyanin